MINNPLFYLFPNIIAIILSLRFCNFLLKRLFLSTVYSFGSIKFNHFIYISIEIQYGIENLIGMFGVTKKNMISN